MDDKIRNSGTETNETDDSPQKTSRRKRTPSADPSDRSDVKSKRRSRSRSRSKSSRSRSPSRDRSNRRRRSRSRGHFSPERRFGGRFQRGGFQRNFYNNRRRRSPSRSPKRGRNSRRSRSKSFDRYRNRRNASSSRERSVSQGRQDHSRPPAPPPPVNFQNEYSTANFQPDYQVSQPPYANQPQYPGYEYGQMIQHPPPNAFPGFQTQASADFMWNTQVPPPPIITAPAEPPPAPVVITEEEQKRKAAIAAEQKIQRDTIRKQRDDYVVRAATLKRELITLKQQRKELVGDGEPPSPTTHSFIKENDRIQNQIGNKISTIQNVIEMLNGIMSAEKSDTDSPKKAKPQPKQEPKHSDDSSPERLKNKALESLSKKRKDSDRSRRDENPDEPREQINYNFFDPEQHWCKACSTFPKTAKEYLLHLHSEEHKNVAKPPEIPWHEHLVKDDMPTYLNAPMKRTPIRGLQFFVPSTAWYCKLCTIWIGDLHCASSHLKSQTHAVEFDKFLEKNPNFENEWIAERQRAFDLHHEKEKELRVVAPPSPPMISNQNIVPPPPMPFSAPPKSVFDGIPLQINQRSKEIKELISEDTDKKKGKKKKKEKKKKKKSKKRHRHSSSSSSSSSEESSVHESPERKPVDGKIVDTSTSIRVAMRNAHNAPPPRVHLKPKSDDEETANTGGWTVVQPEPKAAPPKPPTISANGEAQNRRDEAMISQWTPVPVISEKEKQLFEQLKGKMKNREDKKADISVAKPPAPQREEGNDRNEKERRDESDKEFKDIKDKGRRDAYRKKRSRSPSTPRRDRRSRSRSPRRDRHRRSRSFSPRRDRRRSRSRSPRRDRRRDRYSRSRSKSRERRSDKNDMKTDKSKQVDKAPVATKKPLMTINAGKKLPFIGRMPVFKKQTAEDELKKQEPFNDVSEEEKLILLKKRDELQFTIHQKQQMLHLQQKQAEAYNLAHPGQFANIYQTHGTIHHVLPAVQPEEYDLMPDPMQYATLMTAPPPPMPEPEIPHFEQTNEPVLPPGIDEEEAETLELEAAVPPPPPPSDKGKLPKDFQDALSIIFDRGAENPSDDVANAEGNNSNEIPVVSMQDDPTNFAHMDMSSMDSQPASIEQNSVGANIEMGDQSQYTLYNTEEHFGQNHIQAAIPLPTREPDISMESIPTPPMTVLEVGSDFVMLDPDGNRIDANIYASEPENTRNSAENEYDIEFQNKRKQELDDLAMLGIDADDLAAQCI